jgi:hypothetical protein
MDLKSVFNGINVSTKSPALVESPLADTVNIYLYDISFNPGYLNYDLPTRNTEGQYINNPTFGVDLGYILTAYSKADNDLQDLRSLQILANSMIILNNNKVITKTKIRQALEDFPELANSNLAEQLEMIKIVPKSLSLDETSKLWSSFFQTRYRTSIFYTVSVIILDGNMKPEPGPLVQERRLIVWPMKFPTIDRIEPTIVEGKEPSITLFGKNMFSDKMEIKIGKTVFSSYEEIGDERCVIKIPKNLPIGIHTIQIGHAILNQIDETLKSPVKSNVVPFTLVPRLTEKKFTVSKGSDLIIGIEPGVSKSQDVSIFVGTHIFKVNIYSDPENDTFKKMSIKIPMDFPTSEGPQHFPLKIRVDDVESLLMIDKDSTSPTHNQWVPQVEVKQN